MLGSERKFKIKVMSVRQFRNFASITTYLHLNSFLHRNEIVQYLQNFKSDELDQGHSKKLLQS